MSLAPGTLSKEQITGLRDLWGRLGVRLTVFFLLVAVIPMLIIGVISFQRASDALTDGALSKLQQESHLTDRDLRTFLSQFNADLLSFASTPPVQGIIRARDNDGIDPKNGDHYSVWVKRLTEIFKANAQNIQQTSVKSFY